MLLLQKFVGSIEDGLLDVSDDVAVFADDLGEGHLANFVELSLAEPGGGRVVLVPVSVALFQLLELDADDASKGRAHQRSLQRCLAQATGEQVDVINTPINLEPNIANLNNSTAQVLNQCRGIFRHFKLPVS